MINGKKLLSKRLAISVYDIKHEMNKKEAVYFEKYDDGNFLIKNTNFIVNVDPVYFNDSQLTSVYGTMASRTNEKNFADVLKYFYSFYKYAKHYNSFGSEKSGLKEIQELVKNLDYITEKKGFPYLWHVMELVNGSCLILKKPSFNYLLSFFVILESILFKNESRSIKNQSYNKLPFFMDKPMLQFNKYKENSNVFIDNLRVLRNKVVHGDMIEAQKNLDELIPDNECSIEDAESSIFVQKLERLNMYLSYILGYIIFYWLEFFDEMNNIKNTSQITGNDMIEMLQAKFEKNT
ncbi:hypothetical protein P5763_19315 [Bacillus cereus]|uniref:hypothetical protein n=1 Tax=Bacillus cereus TaxID=1396 RepID=UPI002405C367|nr:hypothetical protein [Bacillus cereus]MDF9614195.1 hypothetical protein [Bacillus cereus]